MGSGDTIDSDCPPVVPCRSRRHSTKGTVVEEKVKQFAEKEFIKVSTIENGKQTNLFDGASRLVVEYVAT